MRSVLITGTSKGIGSSRTCLRPRGISVHATMRNPAASPALAEDGR